MAADLICARCGGSVPAGSKFCSSCGTAQGAAEREERRVVTVLFGDLSGFTELAEGRDAEEVKSIVDRLFERVATIVEEHGGRVDKIIGDEVMAVFGAPQAHEDDPERAVRSALAIRRAVREESERLEAERGITLGMHLGLNTGEVVAGNVGGSDAYSVMGDAVNTARRIEDAAAPNQILVGTPTHDATMHAISYRRIGSVTAKGKRAPIEAWEALAEIGLPGQRGPRRAPLIGREEELALLDTLAALVGRDRHPTLVTLIGEAGLGKSRIAEEFSHRIGSEGFRVLHARSLPYGTATPAFEVEELLRSGLGLQRGTEGDDQLGAVKERLDPYGLAGDAELIAALLGLATAPERPGDAPGSEARAGDAPLALDAARAVVERLAGDRPLALVFHDLHWGGESVLDFVQGLLATGAPLMVLCLARPDLLERRPDWGTATGSVLLRIRSLPRERAGEMLDVLAPALPIATREAVLDRAAGNPFFLEELARLLDDLDPSDLDGMTVPSGVQALVAARLDALPPGLKRIVQDAAVVGERFWPGALSAIGDTTPAGLEDPALDDVFERLPAGDLEGEPCYAFRQTLMREVAANSVPKHLRARHHAAVGGWLEATVGAAAGRDVIDLIAHHYERAATLAREVGAPDQTAESKAREHLERAGDQALGMDSARVAVRFFSRALTVARDEADSLSLRLRLAEAQVGASSPEAVENLEQVLVHARALGDRRAEGKALRLLGDCLRMRGRMDEAAEPLEKALAIAKEIGDEAEEAAGLRARGQLDLFQGRQQAAILWFRQALARFRALDDRRGEGWTLQNLGWASMFVGRLDDAKGYLVEGGEIFGELGDEEGAGWCLGMLGWVHLLLGEIDEAAHIATEIERYLRTERPDYLIGAGFVLELQRILRAYVEAVRCNFQAATRLASEALSSGIGWTRALGHWPPFFAALMERRLEDAEAYVAGGLEGAREFGDPFYVALSDFAATLLAFERGDLAQAEAGLDQLALGGGLWGESSTATVWLRGSILRARGDLDGARAMLAKGDRPVGIALISPVMRRALLAEVLTELGEFDRAVAEAEAGVAEAGQQTLSRLLAMRALAGAHLGAGRPENAEDVLRSELQILDETDWALERVRALAMLARALDERGHFDEAGEILDQARELLAAQPPGTDTSATEDLLGT